MDATDNPLQGHTPAGVIRTLARGVTGRCPVDGNRLVGLRWTHLPTTCPRCGMKLERKEGQFVGAVGINTILSFGAMLIVLLIGVALTAPDIPITPLIIATVATALVTPLLLLPLSKTIWNAIDLLLIPLEPGEAPTLETELARNSS